eukprot:s2121_g4.t1
MERIQRSIHDVLDLRRAKVPNLYRLSDAALMKVLRFGHNPAEPAIRDCLPGVLTLDVSASTFSDGKSVRAIVGDSGEYLSLLEEVVVQETPWGLEDFGFFSGSDGLPKKTSSSWRS